MSARILSAAVATASMPGKKPPRAFPLPSIETPCRQIRSPPARPIAFKLPRFRRQVQGRPDPPQRSLSAALSRVRHAPSDRPPGGSMPTSAAPQDGTTKIAWHHRSSGQAAPPQRPWARGFAAITGQTQSTRYSSSGSGSGAPFSR